MRHSSTDLAVLHESFDSHGWLVLRNVVQRTDVEELNRVFDQLMGTPESQAGSGIQQRPNSSRGNPILLRHLASHHVKPHFYGRKLKHVI